MIGSFDADYVIVGAGSSGSVVAEVLSRSGQYKVLVIEAGYSAQFNPWTRIPLGFGKTYADQSVNWCFETELDPGLSRSDFWPRGRVWGGSSTINGLVWIRPFPDDIDAWRESCGFGWTELRPHFDAIENRQAVVGRDGPIAVENPEPFFDQSDRRLHNAFFEAATNLGLTRRNNFDHDLDDPVCACVGYYHTNTRSGLRVGCAEAFLRPANKRENVKILSGFNAHVLRLEAGEARAVCDGQGNEIRARKEIILCAGSIGSPVILLNSKLKAQLPHLGENLTDHLGINYSFQSKIPTTNDKLNSFPRRVWSGLQYAWSRRGPIGLGINPAGGFVCTRSSGLQPNIQLYLQSLTTTNGFQKQQTGERPLLEPDPFSGFSIGLSSCRPKSRGNISVNAQGKPQIQPNSFSHPEDMSEFMDGVKFLRKLAAQPAMRSVIGSEIAPGPSVQSDEQLEADIRARSGTVYHPVGTCRMGLDQSDAVVDSQGRVFGVAKLRIIDASIFRGQISVNTNATTIALAHKIAAEIV